MREFDVLCLSKVPDLTADEIRAIRDRAGVSQSVFAAHLNVTTNRSASGSAARKAPAVRPKKLLSIVKAKGLEVLV